MLFVKIMNYKVAVSSELANTESLIIREIQDAEGSMSPCSTSTGNMHIEWINFFLPLCMCLWMTMKVLWVLTQRVNFVTQRVTNTAKQVSVFENTESANSNDDCICSVGIILQKYNNLPQLDVVYRSVLKTFLPPDFFPTLEWHKRWLIPPCLQERMGSTNKGCNSKKLGETTAVKRKINFEVSE